MLVLTRKLGERIWVGQDVCITIVDIDRNKVRVAVDAPKDVPIMRDELLTHGIGQPPAARKGRES